MHWEGKLTACWWGVAGDVVPTVSYYLILENMELRASIAFAYRFSQSTAAKTESKIGDEDRLVVEAKDMTVI